MFTIITTTLFTTIILTILFGLFLQNDYKKMEDILDFYRVWILKREEEIEKLEKKLKKWIDKKSWYTMLPETTRQEIYDRLEVWFDTQKELANEYKVSQANISRRFKNYKNNKK